MEFPPTPIIMTKRDEDSSPSKRPIFNAGQDTPMSRGDFSRLKDRSDVGEGPVPTREQPLQLQRDAPSSVSYRHRLNVAPEKMATL